MNDGQDIVELDAEALAMLAMYRDEERPSDAVKERVWQRLESEPAPAIAPIPTEDSSRGLRWAGFGLAIAAALVLAVVGVRGATQLSLEPGEDVERSEAALQHESVESGGHAEHREPEPKRRSTRRSVPAASPPTPDPIEPAPLEDGPLPEDQLERNVPTEAVPKPRPRTGARHKPGPALEQDLVETLATETKLLKQARAALAAGDESKCLKLLSQHAKAFPSGVLSEERDALRAVALCNGGRLGEGTKAAAAFARRYPSSPLRNRVTSACTSEKNQQDG